MPAPAASVTNEESVTAPDVEPEPAEPAEPPETPETPETPVFPEPIEPDDDPDDPLLLDPGVTLELLLLDERPGVVGDEGDEGDEGDDGETVRSRLVSRGVPLPVPVWSFALLHPAASSRTVTDKSGLMLMGFPFQGWV